MDNCAGWVHLLYSVYLSVCGLEEGASAVDGTLVCLCFAHRNNIGNKHKHENVYSKVKQRNYIYSDGGLTYKHLNTLHLQFSHLCLYVCK